MEPGFLRGKFGEIPTLSRNGKLTSPKPHLILCSPPSWKEECEPDDCDGIPNMMTNGRFPRTAVFCFQGQP